MTQGLGNGGGGPPTQPNNAFSRFKRYRRAFPPDKQYAAYMAELTVARHFNDVATECKAHMKLADLNLNWRGTCELQYMKMHFLISYQLS